MTELIIYGDVLEANDEERTISGLLMPWDEIGYTSAGAIQASKGTVEIPQDISSVKLNLEHVATVPVGTATELTEKEDGLHATFRIAKTSAGNDLLEEVKEGLRSALSIEISKPVIKAGRLLSGLITGSAAVVSPAFKSARISTLTASDTQTDTEKEVTMTTTENEEVIEASEPTQAEPIMAADSNKADLGAITFQAYKSGASVQAALADQLASDDVGKAYIQDQEVGELFEARKTERPLVESVGVKPLTSLFVSGVRKHRTFEVADWNGSKNELPTGKFTTSRENWQGSPKAVAVDIDIALLEFGSEEVISDLYAQALDSYIEQTETELISTLSSESTAVSGHTSAVAAVNKASEVLGGIGARMSFVVCSPDVYAKLVGLKTNDAPWWLSSQGSIDLKGQSVTLGNVTLTSDPGLAAGTILVGDARAVDYRESKEFRYRALDVAHGGVDVSLIKFRATKVTDKGAILKFTGITGA